MDKAEPPPSPDRSVNGGLMNANLLQAVASAQAVIANFRKDEERKAKRKAQKKARRGNRH